MKNAHLLVEDGRREAEVAKAAYDDAFPLWLFNIN